MSTLGIAQVNDKERNNVCKSDLVVGASYYVPSPVGGMLEAKCIEISQNKAKLFSEFPTWPGEFTVLFNEPELSHEELEIVATAIEQPEVLIGEGHKFRSLLKKANRFGLVQILSHTQVDWTGAGMEKIRFIRDYASIRSSGLDILNTVKFTVDHNSKLIEVNDTVISFTEYDEWTEFAVDGHKFDLHIHLDSHLSLTIYPLIFKEDGTQETNVDKWFTPEFAERGVVTSLVA